MITQLYNIFSLGKSWTSTTVKTVAPYQPYIAALSIIGKTAWKYQSEQKLKKEVSDLTIRINRLNAIAKTRSGEDAESIKNKVHELSYLRKEKQYQIEIGRLTFWQIPSLFFAHPGANPYQSLHQIYQRGVLINHQASEEAGNLTTIATIAAGSISILGTAASLLRLTGAIDPSNSIAGYMANAALTVHLVEGSLAGVRAAQSAYARYNQQQVS